ncbi:MAG: hypothetical protein NTW19_15120 [Planctomycetota bacterium]|nr:hypothetical protein [Planctomycetota bacterium]
MARRILVIISVLLLVLCLIHMANVGAHPYVFPNSTRDGDFVVRAITRIFLIMLLEYTLAPYLVASVLIDVLPIRWRYLPVAGIWLYILAMLPELGGSGPGSDIDGFAVRLAFVPFVGFPLLLTAKALWLWLEPRKAACPGLCVQCGYGLRGSPGPRCPECGKQMPMPPEPAFNSSRDARPGPHP